MKSLLYVGDPHIRPEELDDGDTLIKFVVEQARVYNVDTVVFLGDLHHTHAILHLEVMNFWRRSLRTLTDYGIKVVVMVGNHDQPGDSASTAHALLAYVDMPGVVVVDAPTSRDGLLFLPYFHDGEKFIAACRQWPQIQTLVCHQTFNGARYENGFYAKDGVDPESIPQLEVISGHIHEPQQFGKVRYLGSPRWLTLGDANSSRGLTLVQHNDDGKIISAKTIPSPCRRIIQIRDTPEAPADTSLEAGHRYYVDIVGPASWIEERRPLFAGRARVRTERTDLQRARVKESEGLEQALRRYIQGFRPQLGTAPEVLEGLVNARIFAR